MAGSDKGNVYRPYGGAKELIESRDPEVLLGGPAGTGKSIAALMKIYLCAWKYPGMRALIVRKTRESLTEAGLVTWEEKVVPQGHPMLIGPQRRLRQVYHYGHGSEIVVGGLDKASKVMSTEYDCVIGETLVESPSEILRGYGRPYSGKLVTVTTAGGHQLTGTPNHPVFTDKGWVKLGRLGEGDYVVCRLGGEQKPVGRANPDVAHQPAPIAEVVSSLAVSQAARTERVESVPMDFHGDGAYGYVDVVTAASPLKIRGHAAGFQHVSELEGRRRDLQQPLLVGGGPLFQGFLGPFPPGVLAAGDATEFAHPLAVGVGIDPLGPRLLGRRGEPLFPGGVGVANVAESLPFRFSSPLEAAGEHLSLEAGDAQADRLCDFEEPTFPFEVTLDRVVQVRFADAGRGRHVYNLQTDSNWYIADGIITHNCIYVQEAIELTEVDWASLLTRLRNGKMPYQQLLADTNPAHPTHWLKKRCDAGLTRMIIGRHEDNPTLVNPKTGEYTQVGKTYLAKLDSLPDMMKKRLRYGLWVQAEGAVYEEWNPDVHVVDSFPVPPEWTRYMSVDFGFINPLSVQFWAADPDGRLYLYREIYKTKTLVEDIAKEVKEVWAAELSQMQDFVLARAERDKLSPDETRVALEALPAQLRPAVILCDHDAEDRKTLEKHLGGVATRAANKAVSAGIQAMAERLKVQKDGKPRLMVFRDALAHPPDADLRQKGKPVGLAAEVEGYVWDDAKVKEQPLKENDHACFVAGTLIETPDGPVPVERVTAGDRVATHLGVAAVAAAFSAGFKDVVRVTFADGRELVCTADHPLAAAGGGWVDAGESLGRLIDARDYAWKSSRTSPVVAIGIKRCGGAATGGFAAPTTKAETGTFAAAPATGRTGSSSTSGYTKRCGRPTTGRSPTAWSSTTATRTLPTTTRGTWRPLPPSITHDFTPKTSLRLVLPPRRGIARTRAVSGTVGICGGWQPDFSRSPNGASSAAASTTPKCEARHGSARTTASPLTGGQAGWMTNLGGASSAAASSVQTATARRNAARQNVGGLRVVAVTPLPGRREVFNLATDDGTYFAGGVLVSNCDAARYLAMHLSGRKPVFAFLA